jgi:hypothetical protein
MATTNEPQNPPSDLSGMKNAPSFAGGSVIGNSAPATRVTLTRSATQPTTDQSLWAMIRSATDAIGFAPYAEFLDQVMCDTSQKEELLAGAFRNLPFPGVDPYAFLKAGTEVFLMKNCGIVAPADSPRPFDPASESARMNREVTDQSIRDEFGDFTGSDAIIPYLEAIRSKLGDVPISDAGRNLGIRCYGLLRKKLVNPCMIELIWAYWHDEAGLAQAMNVISLRFQNRRTSDSGEREALANLAIDPLRPMSNLLWGYVQDEQHRLSVLRRAYEYDHQYGFSLEGKAVPRLRSADRRSKFLEAFHSLLQLCAIFYRQDDDTTVIADGFPLLNALKEVHLLLTQGGDNQFGDLPSNARAEMMIAQWLLARPEMREFLAGRTMVAYAEPWMDRVEAIKSLMGWSDTTVTHFRDLGVFGEQILLSIRYGAWSTVFDPNQAANWARYWRPELQGYQHAYRAVTGVELRSSAAPDATPPSVHLRNRLLAQGRKR